MNAKSGYRGGSIFSSGELKKSNPRMGSTLFSTSSKKRGQLTLFVIVAIVVVAVILVFYLWLEPSYFVSEGGELSFEECVSEEMDKGLVKLSLTGGVISPSFFFLYQDNEIPYYCYTTLPYKTCIVQRPLVKQNFEKNFIEYLRDGVNVCYDESVDDLKELGYNVTTGDVELNLTIIPKRINVEIVAPTTVEGKRFTDYKFNYPSEMYDVLMVTTSLLQYETTYGDSPISDLMFYYPNIIIDKYKQSDSTTVYIVTDKSSDVKFQFASRSLIWPAGYDMVEDVGYVE